MLVRKPRKQNLNTTIFVFELEMHFNFQLVFSFFTINTFHNLQLKHLYVFYIRHVYLFWLPVGSLLINILVQETRNNSEG